MRWPFGNENTNCQPLVIAGPVLVMAMSAPKPLPPSQLLVYRTEHPAACACTCAAPTQPSSSRGTVLQINFLDETSMSVPPSKRWKCVLQQFLELSREPVARERGVR